MISHVPMSAMISDVPMSAISHVSGVARGWQSQQLPPVGGLDSERHCFNGD